LVPRSWASSPDLHLDIDLARPHGRRAALEQALREAIRTGRLGPGTVLPSSRGLAADLGLSRNTVVDAYTQLVAEGYIVTRAGAVTAVADAGLSDGQVAETRSSVPRFRVDLRPGLLDIATTFPRAPWLKAVRSVLHTAPDEAFDYGDPRGRGELRAELATYLARSRGVVTTPGRIMVCAGFSHGLSLLARVLRDDGVGVVAMEDPCLPVHRQIIEQQQLSIAAMPVDDLGARVDQLDCAGARAAIVTPAHQYPVGVTLAPSRRTAMTAWARECDGVVVEDDYDGEFRYDRQPVGAMQGLAAEHVVYAGTVSKTLAPGVRLGWLVLPHRLVEPIVEANSMGRGGWNPPTLEQLALAELLRNGHYDRHLRRLRATYRARRDALLSALADALPRAAPTGIAAGLQLVVPLPGIRRSEQDVRAAAQERGIALGYLGPHWHDGGAARDPGVIIGFARPPTAAFPKAIREVAALLRDVAAD
jgi:GntR family transcriptional regulator/MocR family aminotransferase